MKAFLIAAAMGLAISTLNPAGGGQSSADSGSIGNPVSVSRDMLTEGNFEEARQALDKALPPMSPAAAQAYREAEESRKHNDRVARGTAGLLEEIFAAAGNQGVSKESIQAFVDMNAEPGEYSGKHFLVFISSSMPQEMIRNLMRVMGLNDVTAFVLRGLIGNDVGKILPTQTWIKSFLCPEDKDGCFSVPADVNPVLFDRLKIQKVPAIAYLPRPDDFLRSCDGAVEVSEDDFSALHALETFQKARPDDPLLSSLCRQISRQGFHQE